MDKKIWSRYFIKAQGYKIEPNKLIQDKDSAIILEKMASYTDPIGPNTSKIGTSL